MLKLKKWSGKVNFTILASIAALMVDSNHYNCY